MNLQRIYRSLYRIRKLEEYVAQIYPSDKIKSPIHLSIGQEAPAVGVCEALRLSDVVFGTYRGHALYLAKGGDINAMMAELYGKQTGCGKGKSGSMHLGDQAVGMMGTSAIVATTIPQAIGFALAERMKGKDTVVSVFFGDGATEEGVFWESLNFAALMKLSVLFICENNFYAIHTPLNKRVPTPNYCQRVESFGVKSQRVPNNDVIAINSLTQQWLAEMRTNDQGPRFIEAETYRWREHVGPGEDWDLGFRSFEEGKHWMGRDELKRIGDMLNVIERSQIEKDCELEIQEAFAFAEASPFPADEELYTDVFH